MPLDTVDSLIEALRGRPILRPEQFDELMRQHAPAHGDTQELAKTLIRLRWITIYQAKKLVAGKVEELVVGPYVVLDKLGEGGMGKVYKAMQLSLGRVVALKVVRSALLKNDIALKRFQREVRAAARLNHPNIVRVFDADQVGDRHFLVMEYIAGIDLAKMVKDRGPLPIAMACSVVRQAALGLQHAHDLGFIHRDIKPSNLLIAADTKNQYTVRSAVKILDMGLARVQSEDGAGDHISTELTRTGTVIGTPDFMSPEQAKNSSAVDHRSDLYSLGCTFYFLLTGEAPFTVGNPLEKLLQHQMDPPRPIQLVRLDVPPEVATIVHTLLAKRPDDRFQSGAALAHALERWVTNTRNSSVHPALVLPAEAVDPASATLETVPHDPFDFGTQAAAATPEEIDRRQQTPRPIKRKPQRSPWPLVVAAVLAVVLVGGAIAVGVAYANRKKTDDTSPGNHEPPKQDQPKLAPKTVKADPPPAKDLDSVDRFLPDDSQLAIIFDLKNWQHFPKSKEKLVEPLMQKLGGFQRAIGVDLLAVVERVVIGIGPDEKPGDVLIVQGRSLVTPRLLEGVKSIAGVTVQPSKDGGPEIYVLSPREESNTVYAAAVDTSIIMSMSRERVFEAVEKRDLAKRTKFEDSTIERGLEWANARPFAVYATMGMRSGWAATQPAASKINFIGVGILFDERGMHLHTIADDQDSGKAAELQKAFAKALSDKVAKSDAPDSRTQRIASLLQDAEPSKLPFSKVRRSHLYHFVPARKLDEWLAPFFESGERGS